MRTDKMEHGFKDFNGNTWCNPWVDGYNRYNQTIKEIHHSNQSKLNFYLDRRHEYFVTCCELLTKLINQESKGGANV